MSWPCRSIPPVHVSLRVLSTSPVARFSGSDHGVYGRKVKPFVGQSRFMSTLLPLQRW